MAINFVTGLPRHGKTLWTIVAVKARAELENRQVYTCNIPGINIPGWLQIAHPDEWMNVPDGCIIIIDELQDFWGKSPAGAPVPKPILELSKHGKRGIDFYFITQEPNLVHATPRDLCQHHFYVVRAFGTHNASVRKFERMQLHPEKVKKLGELTPWRYPKEAFEWYKSADVHNIKRSIPLKVKIIPVVLLCVVLAIYGAIRFATGTLSKAQGKTATSANLVPSASNNSSTASNLASTSMTQTPAQYAASFAPRIEGLAYTAPRYDELTKPTTAPFPAACVSMGKKCQCYTQQGTKLQTSAGLCGEIVKNGFFMDFAIAPPGAGAAPVAQAAPAPASPPVVMYEPPLALASALPVKSNRSP